MRIGEAVSDFQRPGNGIQRLVAKRNNGIDLRPWKILAHFALRLPPMPLTKSLSATVLCLLWAVLPAVFAGDAETSPGSRTEIVVSVSEQKLAILRDGEVVKKYVISTSKFGLGDSFGSYRTPLGRLKITEKIGDQLPPGAVLKHRVATGEVLKPNAPGRDPIISRILWLDGQEFGNQNAHGRGVYIHGTPDERRLGKPASFGCIRMKSTDVIELYSATPVGTSVSIVKGRLPGSNPLTAMFASGESIRSNSASRL